MHKNKEFNCLNYVITAAEAATLWRLSRNAITDACRRGVLPGRKSGKTWLVTVEDMLRYQNGRYWPDLIPPELEPAIKQALANL